MESWVEINLDQCVGGREVEGPLAGSSVFFNTFKTNAWSDLHLKIDIVSMENGFRE